MNKVTSSPAPSRALGMAGLTGALLLAFSGVVIPQASAAQPATVDEYQVKLRLDDGILDSSGELTGDAADYFGLSGENASGGSVEQSVYVDTPGTDFADKGWSLRLRHKAGADGYDLTYKYRAPLDDNSLSAQSVDDALAAAKDNNFDSSDSNYSPQVNASYTTSTLDFSNKKSADCLTDDCAIPSSDDVVGLLDDKLPGKFTTATGTDLAGSDATASQVVTQRSWNVSVPTEDGTVDADLEVTAMSGGYFVEITSETDEREEAVDIRDSLTSALDDRGILRHGDAFKTGLILDGAL
ncbi:hypothetical protein ACT3TD_05505 [Corynebacterium sp. AOP36-E1-14]|uniref:hypothetical protein n=1 Tax=unclassified Corynebacterium TaxID=2624378 RepID=UPI003F902D89